MLIWSSDPTFRFKNTRLYEILRDTFTDAPKQMTRLEARQLLLSLTGTVEQKWQERKRLNEAL